MRPAPRNRWMQPSEGGTHEPGEQPAASRDGRQRQAAERGHEPASSQARQSSRAKPADRTCTEQDGEGRTLRSGLAEQPDPMAGYLPRSGGESCPRVPIVMVNHRNRGGCDNGGNAANERRRWRMQQENGSHSVFVRLNHHPTPFWELYYKHIPSPSIPPSALFGSCWSNAPVIARTFCPYGSRGPMPPSPRGCRSE